MGERKPLRVAKQECLHLRMGEGAAIVSMSDYVKLPVPIGAFHGFEWHDFFGPTFCGKRGDILKNQPGERHPVWDIFERWQRAGKLVDGRGYAVLTAPRVGATDQGEGTDV